MNDEMAERIAREMDPLAWVEYGSRDHRQLTLNHARVAIRAVIEGLAREAESRYILTDEYNEKDGSCQYPLADWLRSHLPDTDTPPLDGYTLLGRGRMDDLPVYQKDADSSLWIRSGEAMLPYRAEQFDHTHGLGRMKG